MKLQLFFFLLGISVISRAQNAQTYYYDPALSHDATRLAFVSGGDIWTVPANGGEARLLVSHTAMETRPLFSADGKYLAFISTRTGNGDIYVLDLEKGNLSRLTYDDGFDDLHAWSGDSKYLYYSSSSRDISAMRDVYKIPVGGGTPMAVTGARYMTEHYAAPSPDGQTLAFAARGFGALQWWRNGSSHLDQSEIWLYQPSTKKYSMLAGRGAKQLWPMWHPDGNTLYYISDRNGVQNIWMHPVNGNARQVTDFKKGRVLWPSISKDGQTIVFESNFSIWKFDTKTSQVSPVNIKLFGAPATPAVEYSKMNSGFSNMALSPDGKKVAFIARGDVFVAATKDPGEATRVTTTTGMESNINWLPNSNSIIYLSSRSGSNNIYQYNFITAKETQLTNSQGDDGGITLSPDGKKIAFLRNNQELRILELANNKDVLLTKGIFNFSPISSGASMNWSPDGKWIAFGAYGPKALRNVYVVPSNGGEAKQVSFFANTFGGDVVWTSDGKSILFATSQRTENGVVARIDLQPKQPLFREDQFRDLFTAPVQPSTDKATSKSDKLIDSMSADKSKSNATEIEWEGLRQRISLLPVEADVNSIILSKDGKTMYVGAGVGDQFNIYSYSLDELSREPAALKQITSSGNFKTNMQLTADGKEIYYIENGRIQSVSIDSRTVKPLAVVAETKIDFEQEKVEIFRQAWELQNKGFYDEKFHGLDWNAIKQIYEPLAMGAQTPDELRRILNLMVGELNASHSGVGFFGGSSTPVGKLGLRFDPDIYEKERKLKISEIIAFSPAALAGNIKTGDYLLEVDGVSINATTNLDQLLENKVNKRTVITVSSNANGNNRKDVVVKPISQGAEKGLLYKQWVHQNRDYVTKISGGRLGYVHMIDMGEESLKQFYLDIDAENHLREGVVVDIRNNNGGFVNAYALDVLARRGYMSMTSRGLPTAPARVQLGQRALDAPTILVTNQHSLSDAEDFSEGYRTLELGKIVGEPTASWIIYTSNITLFDGTSVRLPFIKITDNKGNNMELSPRPVDIPVTNNFGDKSDRQLDVAVKKLLEQLGKKK